MQTVFTVLGAALIAWWAFGVFLMAFCVPVYVSKGAPVKAKLATVGISGFILPYLLFVYRKLPRASAIMPVEPTPEDWNDYAKWQDSLAPCDCPNCRARRGE